MWFKLLSSRSSFQLEDEFQTPLNLNSEVSTPKILLLFSFWYFMQKGRAGSIGPLPTLSWRCPMPRIKVWRCPETRTRAGNSFSYWAIQNQLNQLPSNPLLSLKSLFSASKYRSTKSRMLFSSYVSLCFLISSRNFLIASIAFCALVTSNCQKKSHHQFFVDDVKKV